MQACMSRASSKGVAWQGGAQVQNIGKNLVMQTDMLRSGLGKSLHAAVCKPAHGVRINAFKCQQLNPAFASSAACLLSNHPTTRYASSHTT